MDRNYICEKLETLLNIPSPTGNTEKALEFVEKEFKKLGISTRKNNKWTKPI